MYNWTLKNHVYLNIIWMINICIFKHLKIMANCIHLTINRLLHLVIFIMVN